MLSTRPISRPTMRPLKQKWIDHIPLELKSIQTTASLSSFLESTPKKTAISKEDQLILDYKSQLFTLGAMLINSGKAYTAQGFRFSNLDVAISEVDKHPREQHEFIASDVTSELIAIYNEIPRKNTSNKMYSGHEFVHTRYHFLFVCRVALDHLEPLFTLNMFEKSSQSNADTEFTNVLGLYIQFNLDRYKLIMLAKQIGDLFQNMSHFKLTKEDPEVIKLLDVKRIDQWHVKWRQLKSAKLHRSPAFALQVGMAGNVISDAHNEVLLQRKWEALKQAEPTMVAPLTPKVSDQAVDSEGVEKRVKHSLSIDTKPVIPQAQVIERPPTTIAMDAPVVAEAVVSDTKEAERMKALSDHLIVIAKTTQTQYKKKYEEKMKNRYFFTQMIDAGREGQLRAEQFVKQLEQRTQGIEKLLMIYKNHFDRIEYHWLGSHTGNLYDDSFDSMLLQSMAANPVVASYFNIKSEQLLDVASRTKTRADIIQFIDEVIKAKPDTSFAQMMR